ncbi:MAG: hypothetical protein A2287_09040 [Candidatus Melainabacteria bacterium RIFOXYA12_FULL_32_12]|nr:MAG: hypothetical protein A2255_03235 [Candidatus Melainabacteria bacterium RIFOXYA2_FULL_32_9]OGI24628.1 MAG: hypothetical protein A2287_09040 [Candidatus Melainabacteria bacterium RIFOXYA12_FULL_32_12]
MSLTGLQIFKYLPGGKKEKEANCKKCGFPTCMAFAMKLAKKETTLDKCEFISDELKALLEEAGQIQQAEIKFGPAENQITIGNETVMFRHDKKFVNPTCLAIKLNSSDPDFEGKLNKIAGYCVERVGENLKVNAIALADSDNSFAEKAKKVAQAKVPLILISSNVDNVKKALSETKEAKPLVHLENIDISKIIEIEKEFNVPVSITANNLESLVNNSAKALENKSENLVIGLQDMATDSLIENLTYIRRAAIENKFKPLGFPVISFIDKISVIPENIIDKTIWASTLVCKYSNIIVLDYFNEALIYSLLTLRQNIFTDPQKPLQIDSKLYPIGDVDENSPVFVTTNFALTYFTVVSEIEASGMPAYLLITSSDGMSVLTAWSANKFTGETIAKAVKEFNLENIIKHRQLIIPGYVSTLKEEIEEDLPDWETIIGPNDAVDIPDFINTYK